MVQGQALAQRVPDADGHWARDRAMWVHIDQQQLAVERQMSPRCERTLIYLSRTLANAVGPLAVAKVLDVRGAVGDPVRRFDMGRIGAAHGAVTCGRLGGCVAGRIAGRASRCESGPVSGRSRRFVSVAGYRRRFCGSNLIASYSFL